MVLDAKAWVFAPMVTGLKENRFATNNWDTDY
jgi:hypothetical protein